MRISVLLLTISCSILFFSCQKETNFDTVVPPIDTTGVLLKSYTRLDTTLAAPNDTIFTVNYTYDGLNRCTGFTGKAFQPGGPPYTYLETWSYNGTDSNLSKKTTIYYDNGVAQDTTMEYMEYDAMGRMIKDSILEGQNLYMVFLYRYAGDYVYTVSRNIPGIDTSRFNMHYLIKNNDDITIEKDSSYTLGTGSVLNLFSTAKSDMTYDNHPNPLYKVSVHLPVLFEFEHILREEFDMQQKNNSLTINQVFTSLTSPDEYTYQYTYLPNGYPSIARIHYITGDKRWKAIYQYY
jgi:hypothetical protein